MRRAGLAVALAVVFAAASAQGSEARDAYERGTAAFKRGDYATAAREYARADALAPSPIALRAALDAAVKADDPVLGGELLERSTRGGGDAELQKSVDVARTKLGNRAARIRFACIDCSGTVDGHAVETDHPVWVALGQHTVTVSASGASKESTVNVSAGATTEVTAPPPPSAPTPTVSPTPPPIATPASAPAPTLSPAPHLPPLREPKGISPWFFFGGLVVTAGLGAGAIVSGVDTAGQHSDYVNAGCKSTTPPADCASRSSDGSSAELRTDLLAGGAIVVGLVSVFVGIFATKWRGATVSAGAGPGSAHVSLTGAF